MKICTIYTRDNIIKTILATNTFMIGKFFKKLIVLVHLRDFARKIICQPWDMNP